MLHGRVVRPRGQTVYGFGAPIVSVDESSIKHIPGCADRAQGRLPRRRRAARVRRDPGGGAAEGQVGRPAEGACRAAATSSQQMRALDSAGKTIMGRTDLDQDRRPTTVMSTRRSPRRRTSSAKSYGWPTNVHTPIGANVRGRRRDAARCADLRGHAGRVPDAVPIVARVLGLPENHVRVTAVRDGRLLRRRLPVRRHRRRRRR